MINQRAILSRSSFNSILQDFQEKKSVNYLIKLNRFAEKKIFSNLYDYQLLKYNIIKHIVEIFIEESNQFDFRSKFLYFFL